MHVSKTLKNDANPNLLNTFYFETLQVNTVHFTFAYVLKVYFANFDVYTCI